MRSRRHMWLAAVAVATVGVSWCGARLAAQPKPTAAAPPKTISDVPRPTGTHEPYKSTRDLTFQRQREADQGYHYATLAHGNSRLKVVALTFDDGPHPQYTPQLLAILQQNNVKATFFVVGELAQRNPELIRMERGAGHIVGNHSYDHRNLTKIPKAALPKEWQQCQDVVRGILGETMRYCRPPGGDYNDAVIRAAGQFGLTTVLWTDDPGDYASPGEMLIDARILRHVDNGGIILLHDGIQQTVDLLPELIRQLRNRGFRFVTVSELQAGVVDQPRFRG